MRNDVFRLDSISVSSGYTLCLSDFSLDIREGEIMGVIGPSNSGKTALCHVLTGEVQCCGGTLFYRGRPIREQRMPKEIVGRTALIESGAAQAPSLKVSELLALVNPKRGRQLFLNRSWIRKEAEQVLCELSIPIEPEMKAMDLTAAQRHLILIAGAYLRHVELIALDNTINGYTDQEWEAVQKTLRIIMKKKTAVLLTSNGEVRLTETCDRIAVLEQGTCLKIFEPGGYDALRTALAGRRERDVRRERPRGVWAERGGETVFRAHGLRTQSIRTGEFELRRGEIVGFYDPNNIAGQELFSALIKMEPGSGYFELEGKDLAGMNLVKCLKKGIGFIPHDPIGCSYFTRLSAMDNILCSSRDKLGADFLFHRKAMGYLAAACAREMGIETRDMQEKGDRFDSLERLRIYLRRWDFVRLKLLFCNDILETADMDAREELTRFLRSVAEKGGAVGLFGYDRAGLLEVCDSIYVLEHECIGSRSDLPGTE